MDLTPKRKPYTKENFKKRSDLFLQGIYGTTSKDYFFNLIQNEINKAVKENVITEKDALKFLKERKSYYDKTLKEQKKQIENSERLQMPPSYETEVEGREEFKKGGNYNPTGKNRYTAGMRTAEEIQEAIDNAPPKIIDGKEVPLTKKDLRGEGQYYKYKIATRNELDRHADKLKIPGKGRPILKERRLGNVKRYETTLKRSSPSVEAEIAAPKKSKLNFHHAAFKNTMTDLKNSMYIDGSTNRRMAKVFEDPLLKEMEKFSKVFDSDASQEKKTKAAVDYLKNDRALRQKYPEYKNYKTRLSFKRTAFEPGFMVKEKLPNPSLAISQEPGMTFKGETPSTSKGKEIIKKAKEKLKIYGKFAKPIARLAAPVVPFVGPTMVGLGMSDVAKAAEMGYSRPEELAAAYVLGPEAAKGLASLKSKVKGKQDETEAFVP